MEGLNALEYIASKFGLDLTAPSPIDIPNVNRAIMAQTLAELGFTRGAEVGVAAGDHSLTLLENIPDLTLYCVDPWVPSFEYTSFRGSTLSMWYEAAVEKLAPYEKCVIKKMTSMEAAHETPKEFLDFVYIDGAHDFKNIAMDLCEWIRRVRPGGIIYGHDFVTKSFGRYKCHVKDVVEAYTRSHQIVPWFVIGADRIHSRDRRNNIPEWLIVKA